MNNAALCTMLTITFAHPTTIINASCRLCIPEQISDYLMRSLHLPPLQVLEKFQEMIEQSGESSTLQLYHLGVCVCVCVCVCVFVCFGAHGL